MGLFAITLALRNIARLQPISQKPHAILGQVRTEYATLVCYIAHESNFINFYNEYLKQFDASKIGPCYIHTGINGKVLIIIKTEMVPRDMHNGFLQKQIEAIPHDTRETLLLGSVAALLPNDYFERYVVPI